MILALDIGNTHTVCGVFNGKEIAASWRLATDRLRTGDEYGLAIKGLLADKGIQAPAIDGVIISSVVPPVTGLFAEMSRVYFGCEPLIVGPGIKTGLQIRYENPREVGADRVVNAVAALHLYGPPLIILDFGTATTFCAINSHSEYLGGVIAPGCGISAEALFLRAAKLPRVELEKPKTVIGRNTIASIQSGLVYGYLGLVEGILTRMIQEMGGKPQVVATGGLSGLFGRESSMINITNPDLTLVGLRLIYEMNAGKESI
jgi:type III pantothenate kinase